MIPGAGDMPQFVTAFLETPSARNPLGAKGIAEAGTVGAAPAAWNAVLDAVAHRGVGHLDMPVTAEKLWAAASAGGPVCGSP
jgi:carbon-monoxide dehydrogenase large subunit